jgi:hypothetical protein
MDERSISWQSGFFRRKREGVSTVNVNHPLAAIPRRTTKEKHNA